MIGIKSVKLFKIFTILYIFFATEFMGFYGWLRIPLYSVTVVHTCCFALAILVAVVIVIREDYKIRFSKKEYSFAIALLLISLIELWTTKKIVSSYSNILMITEAFPYIAVSVELFVFTRLVKSRSDLEWLELLLEKFSFALNCVAIVQFILFPIVKFLPLDGVLYRNGLPRIYVGGAVIPSIGMLISLCAVFQKKHRRCAYLNIVAFFIVRIVVTQARSETLILIALILIGILNVYKPLRYVRSLIYLILGMAILGILILGDIQLAQSSLYNRDYSIMVRFDGINFFWKKFLEYPIFGMGFLSLTSDKNSVAYTLLSNVRGYRYHRSDVGIFGLLNTFGIVGAFL